MSTWPGPITAISLFTDDVAATKAFYLEVFGLPVHFEDDVSVVFRFDGTLINVLQATEAPELIEPRPVAPADAGARFQLTLEVDDVDARCAEIAARGAVLLNGPQNRPWGIRTACFADPAGHVWEIAGPPT